MFVKSLNSFFCWSLTLEEVIGDFGIVDIVFVNDVEGNVASIDKFWRLDVIVLRLVRCVWLLLRLLLILVILILL